MDFFKAQTNGNDFIIINGSLVQFSHDKVNKIADRRFGVGCDQVIVIKDGKSDDSYCVDFFNADGSMAAMCGNGSCAVGLYISKVLGNLRKDLTLIISDTEYKAHIDGDMITIRFALPIWDGKVIITGNRHVVYSINDLSDLNDIVQKYHDCNIHFIEEIDEKTLRIKTYERGVGWTKACGSGAVAVAFSSGKKGEITIAHETGKSLIYVSDKFIELTTFPRLVFSGVFSDE